MPPAAIASRVCVTIGKASVVAAQVHAQEKLERRGGRELRRAAPAAPLPVELPLERPRRLAEHALGERIGRGPELGRLAHGVDDRRRLARDVSAALAIGVGDRSQHLLEAGQPVPRLGRVVRPPEERLTLGREEHGHRPAAVPGERDDSVHVERVDVGPLLAVDLDADEALVHQRGRVLVLERLALHHVAPVAGGVADGEEDRLVLGARLGKRLVAPGEPVHRVARVLEQVRARLGG